MAVPPPSADLDYLARPLGLANDVATHVQRLATEPITRSSGWPIFMHSSTTGQQRPAVSLTTLKARQMR